MHADRMHFYRHYNLLLFSVILQLRPLLIPKNSRQVIKFIFEVIINYLRGREEIANENAK